MLSALCFTVLTFFSCNSKKDTPVSLVLAEVNPAESIVGQMDIAFKNRVEELSDGNIRVELHFSGILGDEDQVLRILSTPASPVQLARVSASLASYGGKKSKLLTVPYTFNDEDHFWAFVASGMAKEILDEPYELGIGLKGLFYAEEGFRHFFSSVPLNAIDDLQGKKIRSSNAKNLQDLFRCLGGIPVPINYTDLYMALRTGQIEIAEQPVSNYRANSFNVVAPYLILDGHMLGAVQMVINATTWDALSARQQNVLMQAGEYASEVCRNLVNQTEKEILSSLIKNGVIVTQVSDKGPWQQKCAKMIEEYTSEYPDLYRKIRELGERKFQAQTGLN